MHYTTAINTINTIRTQTGAATSGLSTALLRVKLKENLQINK